MEIFQKKIIHKFTLQYEGCLIVFDDGTGMVCEDPVDVSKEKVIEIISQEKSILLDKVEKFNQLSKIEKYVSKILESEPTQSNESRGGNGDTEQPKANETDFGDKEDIEI